MTTIIEKDSSAPAFLLVFVVIILLIGGGLGFASMNGFFGERTTVIENNKTVENKTVVVPVEAPPAAPVKAHESEKSSEVPAR